MKAILLFLALLVSFSLGMNNTLARTPPLGWSSWNCFGGHQSPSITVAAANSLVSLGLLDLGYSQVWIDGGWTNFEKGILNSTGFPTTSWPMREMTDAIHALGVKVGLYVTGGFPAVYGHEEAWSAVAFVDWGFDGIKIDHMCSFEECWANGTKTSNIAAEFQGSTMARWAAGIAKVNATNRVLVLNCVVGCAPAYGPNSSTPAPWGDWCPQTANMWRSSGDINAMWGPLLSTNLASVIGRGSMAGPGGWNYPDSLEIGNGHRGVKLTPLQSRAHFSLWAVTSSPLLLGMNLSSISPDDLAIVSNREAIFVNQAWAGYAGDMLNFSSYPPANPSVVNTSAVPETSVWWKPLPNASAAAVLFNSRGDNATNSTISFHFSELTWDGRPALAGSKGCNVHSIWDGRDLGVFDTEFSAQVPGESVVFTIVSGCT